MSALPPKADMCSAVADVRFGPKADISQLSAGRFHNLTGAQGPSVFGSKAAIRRLEDDPTPLRGPVFRHCDYGAGERAIGLSQLI